MSSDDAPPPRGPASWFPTHLHLVVFLCALGVALFAGFLLAQRGLDDERTARTRETDALRERLDAIDADHNAEITKRYEDLAARLEILQAEHATLVRREEVAALRDGIRVHGAAVERMLARDDALRRVLEHYRRGVGLIYGVYSFHLRKDGELVPATLRGRPLRLEYSGTGFKATDDGHILTNRHVVQPWTGNPEVRSLLKRGLVPQLDRLTITFPGRRLIEVDHDTIRTSPDGVDVAVFVVACEGVPVLPLATKDAVSTRGRRVTVVGYPTGLTAMLARAEPDEVADVLKSTRSAFALIDALAERRMISPVITQGTVNDVRARRIIYDALTTSGGSGGPVFGPDGKVVGVNFAITKGFDGANFGVPILFARELLPK